MINHGQIQRFLRDYASFNILLDEVQYTDADIRDAIHFAVAEYNAITPITNVEESNFPNDWILLMGTCAHLLQSEAFLQLRNQATYDDGDVRNIGVDDKMQLYAQLAQQLRREWKEKAQKIKQQKNMESGFGSLSSGYRNIGSFTSRSGY